MSSSSEGAGTVIHTVGHSNHELDVFLSLLAKHGITAVADVRSSPYSRMYPQFNQMPLKESLRQRGIAYVFMGHELGARSDDPACYVDGRVSYDRLAETAAFRSGLARVEAGAGEHGIALMCAEKEPLDCHRTILVSRSLVSLGQPVAHILADGSVETHEEAMNRLLRIHRLPQSDQLFEDRGQIEADAYSRQAKRIAYRLPEAESEAPELDEA